MVDIITIQNVISVLLAIVLLLIFVWTIQTAAKAKGRLKILVWGSMIAIMLIAARTVLSFYYGGTEHLIMKNMLAGIAYLMIIGVLLKLDRYLGVSP